MNTIFKDLQTAFAYKSNKEIKQAQWLFKKFKNPLFVKIAIRLTPFLMRAGFPINGIIRKTIFKHFAGGETLQATEAVCTRLEAHNVQVILDYGIEGKQTEKSYDAATEEFVRAIDFAALQGNVPFIAVKITGVARFKLLEQLNNAPHLRGGLPNTEDEDAEWLRVKQRITTVCEAAKKKNIGICIDAEETWITDPVDTLTMEMMKRFNKKKVVVYGTLQMYRHDRLAFLKTAHNVAKEQKFLLGIKLVRGAYMEKERERATKEGYESPVYSDKADTDKAFDKAVAYCIKNIKDIAVIIATHNENSAIATLSLLKKNKIDCDHPHIHFSQLYGMSDNMTFNLAKIKCNASKYLPFGPVQEVIPYLLRRAEENSSMNNQSMRELSLLTQEIKRRKNV